MRRGLRKRDLIMSSFPNSHLPDQAYHKSYVSDVTCLEHVKNGGGGGFLLGYIFLFDLQHTNSQFL